MAPKTSLLSLVSQWHQATSKPRALGAVSQMGGAIDAPGQGAHSLLDGTTQQPGQPGASLKEGAKQGGAQDDAREGKSAEVVMKEIEGGESAADAELKEMEDRKSGTEAELKEIEGGKTADAGELVAGTSEKGEAATLAQDDKRDTDEDAAGLSDAAEDEDATAGTTDKNAEEEEGASSLWSDDDDDLVDPDAGRPDFGTADEEGADEEDDSEDDEEGGAGGGGDEETAPAKPFVLKRERQLDPAYITAGLMLLAVASVVMMVWLQRDALSRMWPGFDAIYDKLGLNSDRPGVGPRLTQSGMRLLRIGGIETLVIKGYISNIGKEDKEVADIRLQLLDATNFIVQETTTEPEKSSLSPGESMNFEIRLELPNMDAAKSVVVNWAEV